MNTLILLFASALSVVSKPKPDTVDYWHIFYNNKIIAQYNQMDKKPPIVLYFSKIKKNNDLLKVEYGVDAPCADCQSSLYTLDNSNHKIILAKGDEKQETQLVISAQKILSLRKRSIVIYYTDGRRDRLIFVLLLKD